MARGTRLNGAWRPSWCDPGWHGSRARHRTPEPVQGPLPPVSQGNDAGASGSGHCVALLLIEVDTSHQLLRHPRRCGTQVSHGSGGNGLQVVRSEVFQFHDVFQPDETILGRSAEKTGQREQDTHAEPSGFSHPACELHAVAHTRTLTQQALSGLPQKSG